jgi:nickel/cobalt transporter (NiCoT) family protein
VNITLVSVLVALVVGTIEVISIISAPLGLSGGVWNFLNNLDFGLLGGVIIGVFVVSWLASTLIYKLRGYDAIEAKEASHERTELVGERVVREELTSGRGN